MKKGEFSGDAVAASPNSSPNRQQQQQLLQPAAAAAAPSPLRRPRFYSGDSGSANRPRLSSRDNNNNMNTTTSTSNSRPRMKSCDNVVFTLTTTPTRPRLSSRDNHNPNITSNRPRLSSRDTNTTDDSISSDNNNNANVNVNNNVNSPRRRINSRDIPRTYSGLYGLSNDLLPFETNRQTYFLYSKSSHNTLFLLTTCYLTLLAILQWSVVCALLLLFSSSSSSQDNDNDDNDTYNNILKYSWTVTNAIHLLFSLIYIHWLKGSFCLAHDEQGEMNALTVWEQLVASSSPDDVETATTVTTVRRILLVVPTVLTYLACHFGNYHALICIVNVIVWCTAMLAKLPFMNGVRLFGINRTVGIDDDNDNEDNDIDVGNEGRSSSSRSSQDEPSQPQPTTKAAATADLVNPTTDSKKIK